MARKRGRKATRLDSVAVATGTALGRVAARIDRLTRQRDSIAIEIQKYVRQAEGALRGLAESAGPVIATGRKMAKAVATPKKRRKVSAKARKAISDAQKKRWAKTKATVTKAYRKVKKAATK